MAGLIEKKRKTRDNTTPTKKKNPQSDKRRKPSKTNGKTNNKKEERRKGGPRLPKKMVSFLNPNPHNSEDDDEDINSDEGELHVTDLYEYDEPIPEEESRKNRRYDPVENVQYELPSDFEDENVPSDDDGIGSDANERNIGKNHSDQSADEGESEDEGRHSRMLHGLTGLPVEAFEDKKKNKFEVVSEAYPESEYNPSGSATDGGGRLSIQDLLDPIHEKHGYGEIRNRVQKLQRNYEPLPPPLPKGVQDDIGRKVKYGVFKEDITKWEQPIKRNREVSTLVFGEDVDVGFSTVGAIASEFQPRTDFEKKMASLLNDPTIVDAHMGDGARLLELNKISIEDVKDRHNRLAKMRSLLFRHEMKAKHIKKIKSKTFHRLMKKDKMKSTLAQMEMDPEAAKEQALKQEFKRAEERLTLKHKNKSKWAKRIMKRGLDAQDEGTRAAISEQLHQHTLLTRKMNSMKDSSSSDESSDEDDEELSLGTEQDGASKLLTNAKEKTIKTMEEEDETPTSGVLSLPFMVRGQKKRKEEAFAEAKLALEEYEESMKNLKDSNIRESPKASTSGGRRVFGLAKKNSEGSSKRVSTTDNFYHNSDSEEDFKTKESVDKDTAKNGASQKEVHFDSGRLYEETGIGGEPVFKSFDDIVKDPGPKTTYEVSLFASNSWKKGGKTVGNGDKTKSPPAKEQALPSQEVSAGSLNLLRLAPPFMYLFLSVYLKGVDDDVDTDSEDIVDGILTSGTKPDYELPTQADLIHLAFAGDDVEEEFEKDKLDVLNEENPEPEKPVLLPGWGQWTNIQKKKGMPSWMREEHENAKKKREEVLKKRKDAHLPHVIISEKINKKAEKLQTKTLPFPYTSKEAFDGVMRMPIGPDFNPRSAIGALNRPEVVKKAGVIINPIKYEEVKPHEKGDGHKKGEHQKDKSKHKSQKNTKSKGKK